MCSSLVRDRSPVFMTRSPCTPPRPLTGPRQCGKTTLARMIAAGSSPSTFFDLEAAVDRRRLATPEQTLVRLTGLVVIDEVQRSPALLETVRVLVDRPDNAAQFLLLGSASPALITGVSESLAGRAGLVDLAGFDLREAGVENWRTLWLRGGFPRSYLARDTKRSATVARQLRAHVPGARRSATGNHHPGGNAAPLLDDDRALSRPDLERGGVRGAPWERARPPPGATSTSWPARSWCASCRPGSRT